MNILTILGTAHTLREPGKASPDGRFIEAMYSREIANCLRKKLNDNGYHAVIDYEPYNLPNYLLSSNYRTERNHELSMRVNTVNEVARQEGLRNCIYVSLHNNASGTGSSWMKANGWQVHVSPDASARSRVLAEFLANAASEIGLKVRKPAPKTLYWEQKLFVLNRTICPAVLTENLFMDNIEDCNFLLSEEGREAIINLHYNGITRYLDSICER